MLSKEVLESIFLEDDMSSTKGGTAFYNESALDFAKDAQINLDHESLNSFNQKLQSAGIKCIPEKDLDNAYLALIQQEQVQYHKDIEHLQECYPKKFRNKKVDLIRDVLSDRFWDMIGDYTDNSDEMLIKLIKEDFDSLNDYLGALRNDRNNLAFMIISIYLDYVKHEDYYKDLNCDDSNGEVINDVSSDCYYSMGGEISIVEKNDLKQNLTPDKLQELNNLLAMADFDPINLNFKTGSSKVVNLQQVAEN